MKTKQELEQSVVMLEEALQSGLTQSKVAQADLTIAKQQLADINKPELTDSQLDDINEAVEKAVGNFDFDDADNYNTEFELDYDAKVTISSFEFENAQELIDSIVEEVYKLFVEIDNEDGFLNEDDSGRKEN